MSEDSCLNYICLLEQAGNTSYYNDQNDSDYRRNSLSQCISLNATYKFRPAILETIQKPESFTVAPNSAPSRQARARNTG